MSSENTEKKPSPVQAGCGCVIPAIILQVVLYGFWLRPVLSKESVIDELAAIPPGEQKVYEVFLEHKRMVRIDVEVEQGGPVSVYLRVDGDIHTQFQGEYGYPDLAMHNTLRGKSNEFIMGGYYELVVVPKDPSEETRVDIRVKKHRPRIFTDLVKPEPISVPEG